MEVSVIFDPAFDGKTGPAVWIIDTPANRSWFDRQPALDAGSAVFRVDRYPSMDAAVVHMIWNAQEHHPAWQTIVVIRADLTTVVAADLQGDGLITVTSTGFKLERT